MITCSCGKQYSLIGWLQLERIGIQHIEPFRMELRNCICGSTIAAVIDGNWRPVDPQPTLDEMQDVWDEIDRDRNELARKLDMAGDFKLKVAGACFLMSAIIGGLWWCHG